MGGWKPGRGGREVRFIGVTEGMGVKSAGERPVRRTRRLCSDRITRCGCRSWPGRTTLSHVRRAECVRMHFEQQAQTKAKGAGSGELSLDGVPGTRRVSSEREEVTPGSDVSTQQTGGHAEERKESVREAGTSREKEAGDRRQPLSSYPTVLKISALPEGT